MKMERFVLLFFPSFREFQADLSVKASFGLVALFFVL